MSQNLIYKHKKSMILTGVLIASSIWLSQPVSADSNSLTSNEHTQLSHLNTEQGWSNDVQNITWNQRGYWDIYFLHSADGADNPFGAQGQDWYHTTTKDFVHFTKQNSAISAFGPQGDYTWKSAWTGSVVTNTGNIAGVPKNAKVAYFSGLEENDGGSQNIWGAWSSDNGKTFTHVLNNGNPVINHSWDWTSKNHADERDSSVFYKDGAMYMYTSEGDEIGVYKSTDGIKWSKADPNGESKIKPYSFFKGHSWDGNAPIECPALRTMKMANGQTKQVLFFGAKDASQKETTGTYYTVGHLDKNGLFMPETDAKRLDEGTDFYGANFSGEQDINKSDTQIQAIGWVGNWNYTASGIHSDQNALSSYSKKLGAYSTTRNLTLNTDLTIRESPIFGTAKTKSYQSATTQKPLTSSGKQQQTGTDTNGKVYALYDKPNEAVNQRYELGFTQNASLYKGRIYIDIWQGGDYVRINYDPSNGKYNVKTYSAELNNNFSGQGASSYYYDGLEGHGNGYVKDSGDKNGKRESLRIITDKSSVEIFFPSGQSYTIARFNSSDKQDFKVYTEDPDISTDPNQMTITKLSMDTIN